LNSKEETLPHMTPQKKRLARGHEGVKKEDSLPRRKKGGTLGPGENTGDNRREALEEPRAHKVMTRGFSKRGYFCRDLGGEAKRGKAQTQHDKLLSRVTFNNERDANGEYQQN